MRKVLFFIIIFITIISIPFVFSQEEELNEEIDIDMEDEEAALKPREDFWICIAGETASYNPFGLSYGGSFSFGYGSGSSVGLKIAYYICDEDIDTLELNFLLKFYFKRAAYKGPFIQIMGGPVLFNRGGELSIPPTSGMISGGLSFGWRFVIADRFFIEPSIRGGYPYLYGASVAAGVRF